MLEFYIDKNITPVMWLACGYTAGKRQNVTGLHAELFVSSAEILKLLLFKVA